MSSQQTDMANLMELSDPSKAAFKDLEEENIQLKRQMRNIEADKQKSSAVLNQEIEFLKTQIAELKEREEKGKSLNKNILDALQDLNNSAEKKRLSVQAREELNKAEKQYNRSLSEHKKRSSEENQKLEKENKKLKQTLTEKEAQIKGLRFAIDELQGGYESFRNFMQRNESSFYDEKGSSRSRISTMADDFKDKEANGKILKLEKDLEQIRETVREQSMRLSETTFESARSRNAASPLLMENISLSRISHRAQNHRADKRSIVTSALDDNSYLKIPNEYYSESGGGIFSAKSEVFSRKNEVNSDKLLRLDYNTADHLLSDDMLTPIKKEDIVFQAPQISSFDVIESRVTDSDAPKTREGVQEIQQLFSEREFPYEEQMVYNSKMQQSQQRVSEYQSVPAPRAVHQYQYSEHIVHEHGQISPISPIRREDEFKTARARKVPVPVITNIGRHQKENYDEQPGRFGSGYNSARTVYTQRTNEQQEFYEKDLSNHPGGMKTEIKYMIGRLMKVKSKLDKQTEQLNLSRSPSISPNSRRNSYAVTNGKINRGKKPSIALKRAETYQPLNQIEGLRMEKKSATTPENYQARYY